MPHISEQDFDDDDAADSPNRFDGDDEEPTVECPYCGHQVHADSPRCPACENYLSDEESPASTRPLWFFIGVALGLLAFVRWLFV